MLVNLHFAIYLCSSVALLLFLSNIDWNLTELGSIWGEDMSGTKAPSLHSSLEIYLELRVDHCGVEKE